MMETLWGHQMVSQLLYEKYLERWVGRVQCALIVLKHILMLFTLILMVFTHTLTAHGQVQQHNRVSEHVHRRSQQHVRRIPVRQPLCPQVTT
jgi:hypothetical protein